jgi:hypothetical protein
VASEEPGGMSGIGDARGGERSGNIRASERPVGDRASGAPRRKLGSEVRGIGGAKMKGVEGAKREELR